MRFEDILRNLYFPSNTNDDKKDKDYKVRSLLNYFNQSFSNSVLNDNSQNIDDDMVKFKGWSSMKWYVKNKPIKCGFKFCYWCASETEYFYQFDLDLREEESAEENLGPGAVLKITESLQSSHCMFFL